ncbi:MAG: hypothetical protein AB8B53_07795 [Flavobacteriales bacterium]
MKTLLKTLAVVACILASLPLLHGQNTTEIAGARLAAMSNSGSAETGVWQGFMNPAGILTEESKWQAGASYVNRFGLSELSSRGLVASMPLGEGRVGLVVHSFGYSAFLQNQVSGSYAMKLAPNLRAGLQINYFSLNIAEGFGRYSAFTANLGFQYDFNENISVGVTVRNPNRSQLNSEMQQYVQSVIQGGAKFRVAENLLILADLGKDLDQDPNLSTGLEYMPVEQWFIRGGISTLNRGVSFGFGYQPKKWSIDVASLYHQVLGFSPMISFTYRNE